MLNAGNASAALGTAEGYRGVTADTLDFDTNCVVQGAFSTQLLLRGGGQQEMGRGSLQAASLGGIWCCVMYGLEHQWHEATPVGFMT